MTGSAGVRCLLFGVIIFEAAICSAADDVVVNTLEMKLKRVAAGQFAMGSPASEERRRSDETQRKVVISRPFFMATTEVTQSQWFALMKTKPWADKRFIRQGDQYAATFISWTAAVEFCRKLSKKEGKRYRLPTEAEWEYACRAGTTTRFSFGDNADQLSDYGWYGKNAFDLGDRFAHQVAERKPNAWGLYDLHGNNWEWCSNWYGKLSPAEAALVHRDPHGPETGTRRVIKGGSWHGLPGLCRSACRFSRPPDIVLNDLGFRIVLETD